MGATTKVDTIIDGIRSRIISGEFGEEGRLPSFRKLVQEYETSQETMNKAMQALQAEGLLTSAGVKGVFVNTTGVRPLEFNQNFYKFLQKLVPDAIDEYIEPASVIEAPIEVVENTNLKEGALVFRRFKKQATKQIVFRLEEVYYPKGLLTEEIMNKMTEEAAYSPLMHIKEKSAHVIAHVKEKLLCRLPNAYEQKLLKIVRTNPIIDIKRVCYAKDKTTVISYSHILLNANHFMLSYNFDVEV